MAFMFLLPLSGLQSAAFPQVLKVGRPPVPNPILESECRHTLSTSSAMMPILALADSSLLSITLNPSLLQNICKEASAAPISDFHFLRPSEVLRCFPSAINEYKELACLLMTINLLCCPIFIPRQILSKGVFQ